MLAHLKSNICWAALVEPGSTTACKNQFCSRCQIVVCLAAQIPWDSSSSAPPCLERMGKSQSKMSEDDFAFVVKHSTLGPGEIKVLSTPSQQTMCHWIQHLINYVMIQAWYDEFINECPDGKISKEVCNHW